MFCTTLFLNELTPVVLCQRLLGVLEQSSLTLSTHARQGSSNKSRQTCKWCIYNLYAIKNGHGLLLVVGRWVLIGVVRLDACVEYPGGCQDFFLRKVKLTKDTKPTKFVKNKFQFFRGFQNIVSWSTSKETEIETWTKTPAQ